MGGSDTSSALLSAARTRLLSDGFAGLSTRRVAAEAGVPLSQVHYHFGSKDGLVLALLRAEDDRRLARQTEMYGTDVPLWQRYEQACGFLEDDLSSGYVRLVQELVAAGWSNPEVAKAARVLIEGWLGLLTTVAKEAGDRFGGLGPFTVEEMATLIGAAFGGAESMVLLGLEGPEVPIRSALRRVGEVIRHFEEPPGHREP
jgi:AcrR family transcriptional regulator